MKLKPKFLLVALILSVIIGGLFAMQATNMFLGDIVNIAVITDRTSTVFATLPAISVGAFCAMAILYVLRSMKHPDCTKRITRLYSIIALCLSFIGILGAILSAAVIYGTFFGPYPFPGYLPVFTVLNLGVACVGITGLIYAKKHAPDTNRVKINFLYVLKTIGWYLFICLMLNRFGTFLGMPFYVYARNLYATFPFYLWLLTPVYLAVVLVLHTFGIVKPNMTRKLAIIGLAVNLVLTLYTAIYAINDTAFISSISQAMPLERIAAKPLELIIHFLAYTGVGVALIVITRKPKEKAAE